MLPGLIKHSIKLFLFALVFGHACQCYADAQEPGFTVFTGQINADGINVRADATVGSPVICTVDKGELVEAVAESYGWYKIRLPKQAPSYIKKELVECIEDHSGNCSSGKVAGSRVNVRIAPDISSWSVGRADKDSVVNIIGEENGWYKIDPVYHSYAWINKKFVNKEIVVIEKAQNECIFSPPLPKDELSADDQRIVVEGVVMPYGMVLWRKATHKLVTSENNVYLLKGNRKTLNNLNRSKVKVTGRLIGPRDAKYPMIDVDLVEVVN
jgi:uncharacterized protein YgiM (DUF1202 family)